MWRENRLNGYLILIGVIVVAVAVGWRVGRRKADALLRERVAFVEALPDGALLVRCDGQIVLANIEARQLWGGTAFPQRLEGDWLALCREKQNAGAYVQSIVAPSGKLSVRVAPLGSGLLLFTLEDLAARQRQETFYRNFISNVSHELKTPLTVIQGHVAVMEENPSDGERWQASRRIVAEEAARLTHLVENLLLLSRLEMPDFALDLGPVNLEVVVEDTLLQLSDLAEVRRVSLSLQREGPLPRIMADRARLKQVFINLLDNSVKYNREGGEVKVTLAAEGERVTAQVMDTGEGIPPEDLPHIFEKMYRVERRKGRPVEGSGLGLSIVKRIVEQHGGSITAESQAGQTTFTVTLPHASEASVRQ